MAENRERRNSHANTKSKQCPCPSKNVISAAPTPISLLRPNQGFGTSRPRPEDPFGLRLAKCLFDFPPAIAIQD